MVYADRIRAREHDRQAEWGWRWVVFGWCIESLAAPVRTPRARKHGQTHQTAAGLHA